MSIYMVNGREVELPDEVGDFLTFARECSADQCVAIIGRCAVLAIEAGFSDKDVQKTVNDVTLQIMSMRDKLVVN
jgi:hypothetical protein